ncbi:uncharacterized protein B0H64DRAFT_442303 [Chaetomium fimeti]|uniref:J domain-containing protein n=1 Tax=Chaetomium fimeti TaxID=1854472 RepID=A0AAE0HG42_9PEZI|nr:hypothetical protein B0H64DRAFT_442303 [Chaetomium fimeti]
MTPDASAPRGEELPVKEEHKTTDNRSEPQDQDSDAPRPTKFRFKSKSSRSSRRREGEEDDDRRRRRHRHRSRSHSRGRDGDNDDPKEKRRSRRHDDPDRENHRHRHRHHHRRRRHRSKSPRQQQQPQPPQDDQDHDPFQPAPLSPTTAFRESLFDAMADDEGAAYWESVYGQPIHIYHPPNPNNPNPTNPGGTTALDHMTDDEYAAYVRQKMWEKTHAGLLEARARRDAERAEAARKADAQARVDREMERCLRRGEERRRRKGWRERWEGYLARWAAWEARREEGGVGVGVEGIPWPVLDGLDGLEGGGGGALRDGEGAVRVAEVRAFFVNGIGLGEEVVGEKGFAARLREERVRWHPDKVQQRLGGEVDEKVMRDVTAIFQVVDALWNDTRKKSG